jgi:hypothetical protein
VLRTENGSNIEILPSFLSIFVSGVTESPSQEEGVNEPRRHEEHEGRRKKKEERSYPITNN